MSIPINIDDPTVLRRTLENLETSIPVIDVEIQKVIALPPTATLVEVIEGYNLMADRLNIALSVLNATLR